MAAIAGPSVSGLQTDLFKETIALEKSWLMNDKTVASAVPSHKEACSPRASSAWSTQDGFGAYYELDQDICHEDIAYLNSWPNKLHKRFEQDYDATSTSRSSDLPPKNGVQRCKTDGAASMEAEQAVFSDAAALPDNSRGKSRPSADPAEQQRRRAARQLDELIAMIRNEKASEHELSPSCGFLEQQDAAIDQPITPQMLMIVSSWLAEVAFEFSMQQETLFLAVALLSRFLDASTGVPRGVLQLVAVACMMLAAKQDEVVHPTVQELTDIAANCFTAQDLLRMERILLDTLNWRIKTPTAYTFLHLFTQSTAAMRAAGGVQAYQHGLSNAGCAWDGAGLAGFPPAPSEPLSGMVVAQAAYLTELALLDYGMLDFKPSQVAAAALMLAQSWSAGGCAVAEVQAVTGYAAAELQACMSRLLRLHQYAGAAEGCESLAPLVFIKEKYAQECWLKASLQAVPQMTSSPNAGTACVGGHNTVPGGMTADPVSIIVSGCPVQGANTQDLPGCIDQTQPMDL